MGHPLVCGMFRSDTKYGHPQRVWQLLFGKGARSGNGPLILDLGNEGQSLPKGVMPKSLATPPADSMATVLVDTAARCRDAVPASCRSAAGSTIVGA